MKLVIFIIEYKKHLITDKYSNRALSIATKSHMREFLKWDQRPIGQISWVWGFAVTLFCFEKNIKTSIKTSNLAHTYLLLLVETSIHSSWKHVQTISNIIFRSTTQSQLGYPDTPSPASPTLPLKRTETKNWIRRTSLWGASVQCEVH